jgi:uncharacterized RDD family membrane protein YckC
MSEDHLKTQVLGAVPAYGGFWIRFLAYVVDALILFIGTMAIAFVAAFAGDIGGLLTVLVVLLGPFVYFAAMQSSAQQATLGKALVGLKVTDTSGARISFLRALGRELAKLISSFALMIGFVLAAFTQRKQALHDMVASTLVVRESPGRVVAALALAVAAIVAPFALVTVMGAGILAGMLGPMAEMVIETPSPPAPPPRQVAAKPRPKPPAPPPVQQAKPAAPPAKPAAPAVAVAKETPKPAPVEVVKATPPPPPPPVAKAAPPPPPPPAPKVVAKTVPAPVAAPPAPRPVPVVARGPSVPGPRYPDLMTAVMYQDPAGVDELIAFGKWPDKPDSRGLTPLAAAVLLRDTATVEALLKGGADPGTAWRVMKEVDDPAMQAVFARYRK